MQEIVLEFGKLSIPHVENQVDKRTLSLIFRRLLTRVEVIPGGVKRTSVGEEEDELI
jgi:hypothetical protein